jgi:lysozyme
MRDSEPGFDVSVAQGFIDWSKVATSDRRFAFIKATEGISYVDPRFEANWAGALRAGIARGAYHFAHLDTSPEHGAEHLARLILDAGYTDADLPPALDVERVKRCPHGQAAIDWQLRWCHRIIELTGRQPTIYTGQGFWSRIGNPDSAELGAFPLWLAAYVKTPDRFVPAPWKSRGWTVWQETGDQAPRGKSILRLPGIRGNVDANVIRGRVEDFVAASRLRANEPAAREPGLMLGDDRPPTTIADEVNRARREPEYDP